jgi:hypothetical protein
MVRIAATVDPDPARGERLQDGYARFGAALVDRGWLHAVPSTAGTVSR